MKLSVLLLPLLLLTGCGPDIWYQERNTPTTDAERRAVAEQAEKILAATPRSLSGHDQDWDDAIRQAHDSACRTQCRTTIWEMDGYHATGRWYYAAEHKK